MSESALGEYKQLVEEQGQVLLDVLQSVALGDLDVEFEVPEGVEILSDLAVGIDVMRDDLKGLLADQVRSDLVEAQSQALLEIVQAVALGDLDVEVEVPEGVGVLSDLAIGLEMMIDDLRAMMADQEQARAEIERSRQELEVALRDLLAVQRRYLREGWEGYAATASHQGYYRVGDEAGPTGEAWLPAMAAALQRTDAIAERGAESTLALPIQMYGETLGVLGLSRMATRPWTQDEIDLVQELLDQVAQALEGQRLTDEVQEASRLLEERVRELDLLNEIGREIDQAPPVSDFLDWVAERIPPAMQYPDLCVAAIEYEGRVHGAPEAMKLPYQMVHGLRIGDALLGKIYIAYTERREFLNAESAMLGDIVRRVSGYLENRRLFRQTQQSLEDLLSVQRRYLREEWEDYAASTVTSRGYLLSESDARPTAEAWLPSMTAAIHRGEPVVEGNGDAALSLPIQMYGEVIGALGLSRAGDMAWTEDEIATVSAIVEEVAQTLERQRLFVEAESRAEEQALLRRITETVSRSLEVQELLDAALETVLTAMGFDAGLISLSDEGGDHLSLAVQRGLPEPLVQKFTQDGLAGTLCDFVFQTAETLGIGDVGQGAPVDAGGLIEHGLRAYAGTPLIYQRQRIGTICLFNRAVREMDARELALLEAIGDQLGVGMANARLFEETQARVEEMSALYNISHSLASAPLQPRELAQVIAQGFADLLDVHECSVQLYDRETGLMRILFEGETLWLGGAAERSEVYRLSDYPLTARMMETLQPLIMHASERGVSPEERAYLEEYNIATMALLPLVVQGQAIGLVELDVWDQERHYTPEQINLMVALTNQAAVALENARLFQQTQAALAEVEATHRSYLRRAWQDHLRQREVLERSGFLYDRYQSDRPEDAIPAPDLWRPEIEQAVAKGGLATAAGAWERDDVAGPAVGPAAGPGGERSGLAVPISVRGQTIGVLGIEAPEGERQWTEDDIALIEAISEQLAQTLESARLFADTQRRAERERLIGEITAKIRASTDMHAILETAAVELGQALGTSRAFVRVGLEEPSSGPTAGSTAGPTAGSETLTEKHAVPAGGAQDPARPAPDGVEEVRHEV